MQITTRATKKVAGDVRMLAHTYVCLHAYTHVYIRIFIYTYVYARARTVYLLIYGNQGTVGVRVTFGSIPGINNSWTGRSGSFSPFLSFRPRGSDDPHKVYELG